MKDIDKSDAPLGYYAVEPIEGCLECAFDEDFSECFIASKRCVPSGRRGQSPRPEGRGFTRKLMIKEM